MLRWAAAAILAGVFCLLWACSKDSDDGGSTVPATLQFVQPSAATQVPFNAPANIIVRLMQNGVPAAGAPIELSTTRGILAAAAQSAPCSTAAGAPPANTLSVATDSGGQASAYLCSDGTSGAGGATVTASAPGGAPSATLNLVFIATTPASLMIQALPTTIARSEDSTITAVVRDAASNPVPNQHVTFTLTDSSGGSLSTTSAVTDQTGSASVSYRPNPSFNSPSNVRISIGASVDGSSVSSSAPAQITIVGTSLRITLGTSNRLIDADQEHYQLPYDVLVSDSVGNSVPNATVNLTVQSIAYQKGLWVACNTTQGATLPGCQTASPPAWTQDPVVPASDPHYNGPTQTNNPLFQGSFGCLTEDPDNTGTYSPTLDYNGNGVLDPGMVASVPATVQLDSTGSGQFAVTYPKDHADWVEALLKASIDTNTSHAVFVLPMLAADVSNAAVPPPGQTSPYGTASSCANPH